MNDYGIKKNKGYRCILVLIDSFCKFGWTIPLKNKYEESITDAFSQIPKSSKRKPNPFETDDGEEYVNESFNDFLNNHNLKRFYSNTALLAVFAERFKKTVRNLLKKPVFLKGNAIWLSELPTVLIMYKKTILPSTKRKPNDASVKINEKEVYSNLQDKR